MIKDKSGDVFVYDGKAYTVGGRIVCTDESEYEGLSGVITEIRDGEDKETANETPDLYCDLTPPTSKDKIKALEAVFSELYGEPKTIDEIIFDCVIMAPSMVKMQNDGEVAP